MSVKKKPSAELDNYTKFLSLWRDAYPRIAEAEDAKKRVAGLKSQQST